MTAIGDVFKVRMFGSVLQQECMCRLHYRVTQLGTNNLAAADLAAIFATNVVTQMTNIMSNQAVISGVEIQNLMQNEEYGLFMTGGYPNVGDVGSSSATSFLTYTFRKNRPHPPLRHGYLRLWGVAEGVLEDNYVGLDWIVEINQVSFAIAADQLGANGWGFEPVVVRNVSPAPPLPAEIWRIPSVAFIGIGSQLTRKR
jgi:hypothetical protein